MMELEHDDADRALERIRELTNRYAIPAYACPTYKALMDGLRELEMDLHMHIHLENNILFPRALQLEPEHTSRTGSAFA
jgi:regulator of cell morphogenesis and NO signaling